MPPYIATVNAGAATVMSSFIDINGIPSTANVHWLKDVLRTQLGFSGLIVSDWYGIDQLKSQGVAKDDKEAAYKAFAAGTDVDMVDNLYGRHLEDLIKEKKFLLHKLMRQDVAF
jgi:beta-glucosidase